MPVKHIEGDGMIAALFSGGKDSTLALHKASREGSKPDLLITMHSGNPDSYMFHKPNIAFTSMQAEALGIKHIVWFTEGKKEKELEDLERALEENGVKTLVTGAIASTYQKARVDALCKKLGIIHIAPLWGADPVEEITEVASTMTAIITKVAAEGFDQSFLGKVIDARIIDRLLQLNKKYRINVAFEGGEAESFVLDAPMFAKSIEITKAHAVWNGMTGEYVIEDAKLVEKKGHEAHHAHMQ